MPMRESRRTRPMDLGTSRMGRRVRRSYLSNKRATRARRRCPHGRPSLIRNSARSSVTDSKENGSIVQSHVATRQSGQNYYCFGRFAGVKGLRHFETTTMSEHIPPYLLRAVSLPTTPLKSSVPRTTLYLHGLWVSECAVIHTFKTHRTPGRS